jgi:hypothetical protein
MSIDVSMFPVFKDQTLALVDELETVYLSEMPVGNKANDFNRILQKYGCA